MAILLLSSVLAFEPRRFVLGSSSRCKLLATDRPCRPFSRRLVLHREAFLRRANRTALPVNQASTCSVWERSARVRSLLLHRCAGSTSGRRHAGVQAQPIIAILAMPLDPRQRAPFARREDQSYPVFKDARRLARRPSSHRGPTSFPSPVHRLSNPGARLDAGIPILAAHLPYLAPPWCS